MEGQIPGRDFVSLQPPLSFYATAIVFKFFGVSLASLRALGLLIYVTIPLLIYLITRRMLSPAYSLAASVPATVMGIPYFNFVPFAVWQGIVASLAAAYFFVRAVTGGKHYWAFPAGLFTALSLLSRHDQGFYLIMAFLLYIVALKYAESDPVLRPDPGVLLKFWVSGILVVLLPSGLYWFMSGAVSHMVDQLIVFPLMIYAKTSALPLPSFTSDMTFIQSAIHFLFYVPMIVGIMTAIWLLKRIIGRSFYLREARISFLLVWSGLFYCQVLTRSDLHHLMISLPPFFILCVCCFQLIVEKMEQALGRAEDKKGVGSGMFEMAKKAVIVMIAAGALWFMFSAKPLFFAGPGTLKKIDLARGGVYVQNADMIVEIVRTIQRYAPPDRSILSLPYAPMFYFLCERRNPTRWNYFWPGDQTEEEYEAFIRQARKDPPAVILLEGESRMNRYASAVVDYVKSDYRKAGHFMDLDIYTPLTRRSS